LPIEDDEEVMKRCEKKMDTWMKVEEEEFLRGCLKKLGLTERRGLDGQIMLYPLNLKEKKLDRKQF
jgi:hypothetical protein